MQAWDAARDGSESLLPTMHLGGSPKLELPGLRPGTALE